MRVRINWELLGLINKTKAIWFNNNIVPKKRYLSIIRTVYPN